MKTMKWEGNTVDVETWCSKRSRCCQRCVCWLWISKREYDYLHMCKENGVSLSMDSSGTPYEKNGFVTDSEDVQHDSITYQWWWANNLRRELLPTFFAKNISILLCITLITKFTRNIALCSILIWISKSTLCFNQKDQWAWHLQVIEVIRVLWKHFEEIWWHHFSFQK